ncbi:MAG: riboflavin synthase [Bacteroidetes bacterium]|nr:riboflavin synthase [Bacteroidota bacterium]
MFTGIVEEIGVIIALSKFGDGLEITISARKALSGLKIDNSICVNGVCLTVIKKTASSFTIQAVKETLSKTNLGQLQKGTAVNLERSVRLQDRLGGHLVQGHVDTTGSIKKITTLTSSWMFTVAFPKKYRRYLIPVGSVTVDGTSLTIAALTSAEFTIAIIPYTYNHTVFGRYKKGDMVNLEFDIIGKYLESLVHYT